jgi:hypothetical protein
MRKLLIHVALIGTIAVGLVAAPHGMAASSMARESVPESAFASYRAMSAPYRETAPPGYGAITDNQGISCIADPAGTGAMGVHYVDVDNLVALEYIVFKDGWDATHSAPPELFAGHPFMVTEAGNRFDLPAFYSQHVWVWRGNALGNLWMWNPAVHCPS